MSEVGRDVAHYRLHKNVRCPVHILIQYTSISRPTLALNSEEIIKFLYKEFPTATEGVQCDSDNKTSAKWPCGLRERDERRNTLSLMEKREKIV